MQISKNGITLDVNREGKNLTYQVLKQNKSVAETLRLLVEVVDKETGYSLRSSRRPFFHKGNKRFYIRGTETQYDNLKVETEFKSEKEAEKALAALERLLDKIKLPKCYEVPDDQIVIGNGMMVKGGSSMFRMMFLTRSMAEKLQLTCHQFYQDKVIEWVHCKPPTIPKNPHATEHISQAIDCCNKFISKNTDKGYVVNPHNVTKEQAIKAINSLRKDFEDAENGDYLVAYWRILTNLRAPDVE